MSHLCHNQNRLQKNIFMENLLCHFWYALACKYPLDHWSQEWTTKCIKSENSNNIATKTYQIKNILLQSNIAIAIAMVRTLCNGHRICREKEHNKKQGNWGMHTSQSYIQQ
jgi:hypothetical protein